jgi:hypothetical protein
MTKAQENWVERIVVGPKPIWGFDENGERKCFEVGSTIRLPPHQAKSKARYLQIPGVVAAQEAVAEAEAKAEAEANQAETAAQAASESDAPAEGEGSEDDGGGSDDES